MITDPALADAATVDEPGEPREPQALPTAPIYIISKGRADTSYTHRNLHAHGIPHLVAVEPQEADQYAELNPAMQLLVLPFSNLGQGSIPARNAVWDHAVASGAPAHWILDDNIPSWRRRHPGDHVRRKINPAEAFVGIEAFCARYSNIGIAGCEYHMFSPPGSHPKPVSLNRRVFSNLLINHGLDAESIRWRGRYNEDTDLCLQTLTTGRWCTFLFNHWLAYKLPTLQMKGGNATELYTDDGRVKMARSLERQWPRLVETYRVYDRAQHRVRSWNFPQVPERITTDG